MAVSRRMARPLLASMFVMGGVDALMNPASKVDKAKDVGPKVAAPLGLPGGSGDAGAASTAPCRSAPVRCSPSASCRGWRRSRWPPRWSPPRSPATGSGRRPTSKARATQRIQFFKNVSMLGGLLLAAVDTEGRPSLSWRAHRAAWNTPPTRSATSPAASCRPDRFASGAHGRATRNRRTGSGSPFITTGPSSSMSKSSKASDGRICAEQLIGDDDLGRSRDVGDAGRDVHVVTDEVVAAFGLRSPVQRRCAPTAAARWRPTRSRTRPATRSVVVSADVGIGKPEQQPVAELLHDACAVREDSCEPAGPAFRAAATHRGHRAPR